MPKRVIDGEAVWGSDRLTTVPPSAQREYPWLYPLADSNGSFEITNLRTIWGKVYINRPDVPDVQNLDAILHDYNDRGLLFIWEQDGKRYAHWTNSHKPGRLPPKSRRATRHENLLAPVVPLTELQEYASRFGQQIPHRSFGGAISAQPQLGSEPEAPIKHDSYRHWKGSSIVLKQFEEMKTTSGNRCLSCGNPEHWPSVILSADHVIPLSLGGEDSITNIQPLCRPCNLEKSVKTTDFRDAALIDWAKTKKAATFRLLSGSAPAAKALALALALVKDKNTLGEGQEPETGDGGGVAEYVKRIWEFYLQRLVKSPKMMTLTILRKRKATARFQECLKKTDGDPVKAEGMMRACVEALASSKFHMGENDSGKRYDSWEKHLFPSQEKLEWWLERANPQPELRAEGPYLEPHK